MLAGKDINVSTTRKKKKTNIKCNISNAAKKKKSKKKKFRAVLKVAKLERDKTSLYC